MQIQEFSFLPIKCGKCQTALVRVTLPEAYDRVYCTDCGAAGDYKEVVEGTAGLMAGLLTQEELLDLREQFRLARKQGVKHPS